MPPRSSFPFLSTPSDSRTATLQGLLIAAIVIAALHVGREVLVPLALAILLSFVLTPPLLMLRRIKVPRAAAVGIVVGTAFAIILGLGWLISREATDLAADLPGYRYALSEKIKSLREGTASSPVFKRAGDVLSDLQKELSKPEAEAPSRPTPTVGTGAEHPQDRPITVVVSQPEPTALEVYQTIAGTLLAPLATAGIVLLFVVFILFQREDLRDRLIRLFGASDLQRATSTMTDAASRLSRYFLSQVLINSAYGLLVALALWLIGMPSPFAWGILATLMRFVPYVGAFIAAALPLLVAAAADPGWTTFFLVLALYLVGELTMGQVVEPLVFGRGTGVSPIAVIFSTVFWTWLWGPLGLLLAMPITVCLAVLGRHVDGLGFFEVLLGDEPALTPEERFYQRALSGDAAEATYQAESCLKDQSLVSYLDRVALPGLKLAEGDEERGMLDKAQSDKIAGTVQEMLDNLADFEPRRWFSRLRKKVEKPEEEAANGLASLTAADEEGEAETEALPAIERDELAPGWVVEEPVISIGGRTALDAAAASMLAEALKKRGLGAKALAPEAISAAHIASLAGTEAKLVCLSYLGLGTGPATIRYLVRRLRRILPAGTTILVGYWAEDPTAASVKALAATADADAYATSLHEAVELCVKAAKGELAGKELPKAEPVKAVEPKVEEITPPPPVPGGSKPRTPTRKSQTAAA
jgi:predicted PurR-regulated permease PerM